MTRDAAGDRPVGHRKTTVASNSGHGDQDPTAVTGNDLAVRSREHAVRWPESYFPILLLPFVRRRRPPVFAVAPRSVRPVSKIVVAALTSTVSLVPRLRRPVPQVIFQS